MMKFIALLITVFLFVSCKNVETKKNPFVVLCFENYSPKSYTTPGGMANVINVGLTYINAFGKETHCFPDSLRDTLKIDCESDFVECLISYRNLEPVYFSLFKGDTVHMTMDSLCYPIVRSKHSKELTDLYNIPYSLRRGHTHLGVESQVWLGNPFFIRIAETIDYIREQNWILAEDYCPIDTLQNRFSSYSSSYIDAIQAYKRKGLLSDKASKRYLYWLQMKKECAESILKNRATNHDEEMKKGISDSLLCYPSYRNYLRSYLSFYNSSKGSLIKETQGPYIDLRKTFDQLAVDSLPPLSKNILLRYCMENMGESFSGQDILAYSQKYLNITSDTAFYNQMITTYNLLADENELLLLDSSRKRTTYNQLLEQCIGKVVYVDFWASWCVPCREGMPASAKLREMYKGKDVVFVYLAYNDTKDAWCRASKQLCLSDVPTNYWIENSKNSTFLQHLPLKLIPRYFIYDKQGKLVNRDAPRPESLEIQTILNRYL